MTPKPDSLCADSFAASPNHGERLLGVDSVILHYTGMATGEAALARLCDLLAEVSCHYLVWEDGRIHQLVPEARRAWHAGRSLWRGESDMNSRSIGVEIVNPGHAGGLPPFPPAQVAAVTALCRDIARRWRIQPWRFLAHSDIAPGRKEDPGEKFPWGALHREGVGHFVAPLPIAPGPALGFGDQGEAVRALQSGLAHYGYGLPATGIYDAATLAVVAAFQRHFRPARVDGQADFSTLDTLRRLLAALPQETRT